MNNYSFVGGVERVTCLLSNELSKEHDVDIISLYDTSGSCSYPYNNNINITVLYRKEKKNYLLETIPSITKLKNIIKAKKYDYLIYAGELLAHYAILACKNTSTKCVGWTHTPALNYSESFLQKPLKKFMVCKSDFVITLTKESADILKEKYNNKNIFYIPNPIDPILNNNSLYDSKSKKIITVGRISYQKNYETLVKVAAQALPNLPEWTWDIYGNGDEQIKKNLISSIKDNRLENRLNLKGVDNNIYNLYEKYSFIVMTSRYEGFPMVLLEALSKKLPMIAFDISTGPKEIILEDKNGHLVKPFDVEEMSKKIIALANDPNKRIEMSKYNETYRNNYSIEQIIVKWNDLLLRELNK